MESYDAAHRQPFFYNQITQESTWERPEDLAWVRVTYTGVASNKADRPS